MSKNSVIDSVGRIGEDMVQEVEALRRRKRPGWMKWAAVAACLCVALGGWFLYDALFPPDFYTMISSGTTTSMTPLYFANINVDGWSACYYEGSTASHKLEPYVGELYLEEDSMSWYRPKGTTNLEYLIQKDSDGTLSLWYFASFNMGDGETHTYGDILRVIYGVESPDDIVSITTSPTKSNNTNEGIAIQKIVGTHTYTDREDIEAFFDVVWDVVCYGTYGESEADENRFTYSFSTNSTNKVVSGEDTYGTRCIEIEFADGSTLNSWMYSALSGSFYEYGMVYTEPLAEEDVAVLNELFGIK